MEFYFFLFCGIGLILGFIIKNIKAAIGIIAAISFCWFFIYGKWAFLSFVELLIGYFVVFFANAKSINFIEKMKLKKKEKEAKNKRIKLILLQIVKEQHESLSDYMDAKFKGNDITNYNNIITNYYMENGKLKKAPTLPELIIFYTSQARVFFDKNRTDEKILNEMYKLIYSDAELRESIYDNLKLCIYICGWYDSSLFQVSEALSSATKKEIKKIIHDAIW